MQSKHQISRAEAAGLMLMIQKASGLNQRVFDREIGRPVELEVLAEIKAAEKRRQDEDDKEEKFELPPNLNPEQHLFDLCFKTPGKPIKVIDHAFREYSPEYGYWQSIAEESLAQRVMDAAKKAHYPDTEKRPGKSLGTVSNVRKTLDHAGVVLFSNSLDANNNHLIAFRNGTVCTKTGDLSAHNSGHHITAGLPYEYRKGAECPEPMKRYIASSFGTDNTEYVRAGLGCVLDLTAPDKFLHAIGPSGSGKGVLTRLVMKFFGQESVGSPNNFKLFANPDQVHQYLSGKRLIAIDDIVGFVGEEIGRFYTAVERTAMNARCLFKPKGYTQQFDIRYIVASTSQLPTKYSNSKGWERRVFPMPTLGRQEPDDNLERELEGCIADIISWALAQDKIERNAILKHPERYNELAEEYFIEAAYSSSSAWGFVEECLQPVEPHYTDTIEDQTVEMGYIYNCYKAYCAVTGRNAVSLDNLKHELRQAISSNYVKRCNRGKIPARFVYFKEVSLAFDTTESGIVTCDLSRLSHNGVFKFKDWAKQWGSTHPYMPGDIPTGTQKQENRQNVSTATIDNIDVTSITSECNESVTQNVAGDTKTRPVQAVQAVQGSNLDASTVCGASTTDITSTTSTHHTQVLQGQNGPVPPARPDRPDLTKGTKTLTVTQGVTQEIALCQQRIIDALTAVELEKIQGSDKEVYSAALNAWRNEGLYEVFYRKLQRLLEEEESVNS
ncbi:MAG: hypothetical protein AAGD09_03410 [Cyanobacteria bacterium P01_F01_bin.56]